ncbi:uncharacterized protein C8A04DRAFT_29041 [Dichotomopilus funicola]|uniref:PhoD-like phosphatase domain-containing protein n=1 Tax=Dichotomopilus funicola TaxID=1934379 RepID=A0AAN6ZN53_9PEZI|nr:hypothetical protein C8A04DRAFT_29041 [Dichotomopilus funicola]
MSSHQQHQQHPDSGHHDPTTPIPPNPAVSPNPHSSSSRWRHAESSAYARHERKAGAGQAGAYGYAPGGAVAREADPHSPGVGALTDFLNKSRIDPGEVPEDEDFSNRPITPRYKPVVAGASEARAARGEEGPGEYQQQEYQQEYQQQQVQTDGKEIVCGPLLNYRRMEGGTHWIGSALVVTAGGGRTQPVVPVVALRRAGGQTKGSVVEGVCLYSDARNTFWRFDLVAEMDQVETQWEYELPGLRFRSETKPRVNTFFVPARHESMRIMFHSCNGFSVGTDEAAWSGPALWNDVMRKHQEVPFHVMIGGGDQIYNDGIRVSGPLQKWSNIGNPKTRKDHPFPESLRQECDDYYLKNYIRWYSTEPFAGANGQIPQLNIWDDHDIIDGFGSYVNEFMKCDVFRGIGGTAHKYYMLFQHHLPPPPSTYTSDAAINHTENAQGQAVDPNQTMDVFVHPEIREPNYIYGPKPGPYVAEHSHNMFAQLGARIAFLGIDARTERTRHQVNYAETYEAIFSRLKQELAAAASAGRPFRHLILLLGIPIAYPRLTWLENIFASPLMGPVKFLNRRIGFGGSFFNSFDGSVDLLDDLDDHYTARTHKKERNWLIHKLQGICAEFSLRITILGGDVHLAAFGRFYSNPHLNIPIEEDYRYIVNVVSSAIVNKPPPAAVANLLARRNRIHHLDHNTHETLLKLFDRDPGDTQKTADHNKVTMPSRNFAMITENSPYNQPQPSHHTNGDTNGTGPNGTTPKKQDPRLPLSAGETNCGTTHKAASFPAQHGRGSDGSLDVCIWVEQDQHDATGRTQGYGLTVPALVYGGSRPVSVGALPPPRALGSAGGETGTSVRTSVGSE